GALIIPDFGWLLGAVLGGLLGQLLHISKRLQELEHQLGLLKNATASAAPVRPQPEPSPQPRSEPSPVTPTAITPQAVSPIAAAAITDHAAVQAPTVHRKGILEKALERVRRFFLEGNPIVRMGMV